LRGPATEITAGEIFRTTAITAREYASSRSVSAGEAVCGCGAEELEEESLIRCQGSLVVSIVLEFYARREPRERAMPTH
jgi:hypothetical protein